MLRKRQFLSVEKIDYFAFMGSEEPMWAVINNFCPPTNNRDTRSADIFLFAIFKSQEVYKMKQQPKQEEKAQLSEIKMEQLNRQPIIESNISKSEDGKWIIHKTTITDIKPITYFEKVLG